MKKWLCLLLCLLLPTVLLACGQTDTGEGTPTDAGIGDGADGEETTSAPVTSGDSVTEVDLILFAGGVDLSGRGDASLSTPCGEGHAYEFRAVSDPTRLYPMTSSFGSAENREFGLSDDARAGGPVPAFCEAYYQATGTLVVAVSASDGGSASSQWTAGKGNLEDAVSRLRAARQWLEQSEAYALRHTYVVWLQGEGDVASGVTPVQYQSNLKTVSGMFLRNGAEQVLLIQTGSSAEFPAQSLAIQDAQRELCTDSSAFTLICDLFSTMSAPPAGERYRQEDYNTIGADAGANAARYVADPAAYRAPDHREHAGAGGGDYDGPSINLPTDEF